MKRFFLLFFTIFLLFLLVLGFISLNLEYFLNKDFVKKRLKDYVAQRGIELDYKRIHVNPYKLKVKVEELKLKGKDFEFFLPRAEISFLQGKILKGNFYPSFVYLKEPKIRIIKRVEKEEKPFEIKEIFQFLSKASPFNFRVKKGSFEFIKEEGLRFSLENLNLTVSERRPQLLFEGNATGQSFSFLSLKGRLNHEKEFFEGSLNLKKLNLAKLELKNLKGIERTDLDLSLEINYEKGVLNLGFTGSAPCLAFAKNEKPYSCGFFQGYFTGSSDKFELKVSPLELKYPEARGEIVFRKEPKGYFFLAKLNKLNLSEIEEVLSPYFSEEDKEGIFGVVKGGIFSELKVLARAKDIKSLFLPENLEVESKVSSGEVLVPKINLLARSITGNLLFKGKKLHFEGEGVVEDEITAQAKEFSLDFAGKELLMSLSLSFNGEGRKLLEISKKVIEGEKLKGYEVWDRVTGELELKGPFSKLEISLVLRPEATKVQTPYLKNPLVLKRGEIAYRGDKISLKNLKVVYEENFLENLWGTLDLKGKGFELRAEKGALEEPFLRELLERAPNLKELFEKYALSFNSLNLYDISYKGNLESLGKEPFLQLLKPLSFSGELKILSLKLPFQNETFEILGKDFRFALKENQIKLLKGDIKTENSTFQISGVYDLVKNSFEARGEALLSDELLEKALFLKEKGINLRKEPLKVSSFNLSYEKEKGFFYAGRQSLGNLETEIKLSKDLNFQLEGKVSSQKTDFVFTLKKEEDRVDFTYQGRADLSELFSYLEEKPLKGGGLEGEVRGKILLSEWESLKEKLSFNKIPEFLKGFLEKRPLSLEGELTLKKVESEKKGPIKVSGELSFRPAELALKNLDVWYGKSELSGNLDLSFEKDLYELKGALELRALDLKELEKEKGKEEREEEISQEKLRALLFKLPLATDLSLKVEKLTLPTSHELNHLEFKVLTKKDQVRIIAEEINLCNLHFYGEYEINPEFQYLFVDLKPTKGDFLDLFSCLYPEEMPRIIFEGPYRMEGFFYTDGEKRLLENTYGKVEVRSEKGYVYRAPLIARVLGFLSPIDLFRGKIPNLENNLLPYEELNLDGEFKKTSFRVEGFFLSAPGFRLFAQGDVSLLNKQLDLTFLVSPFKTVDVILEHIPLGNRWVLGKERMFIYLPLEVIGTYDNPTIVPLHPASIGKGLFRFVFKFFGIQEEFFKKPENFEGFKRPELFKEKSGNSIRR